MEVEIHYIAILLATLSNMILGALWYSPLLFANFWMRSMEKTKEEVSSQMKEGVAKAYMLSFVAAFLMSFVLAHFLSYAGANSISEGFVGAFWIWIGFIMTSTLSASLFEKRPFALYFLYGAYQLLALFIMSAIIVKF